jgi:hypothetical protein
VAEARSGIRQANPEIRPLVDKNYPRRRFLPKQVKSRECSTYPSTDDCDCRAWFFPCAHVSTLGQTLRQRNSQILMPYKPELSYPSQAKKRLEWGTQPLLLVQGAGVKADAS